MRRVRWVRWFLLLRFLLHFLSSLLLGFSRLSLSLCGPVVLLAFGLSWHHSVTSGRHGGSASTGRGLCRT